MECKEIIEQLAWYANAGLEAAEHQRITEHLAGCPDCRRQLRETQAASVIFGGHPPPEALLDYASGCRPSALPCDVVEAHLAACDRCAEELALVRESREAFDAEPGDGGNVVAFPGRHRQTRSTGRWRRLAVAASFAAMVMAAGWLWTARTSLDAPQPNVAVADLFPDDFVLRADTAPVTVQPAAGARTLTLILNSERAKDEEDRRVEITDADGHVVQRLGGLRRQPDGGFTLTLPLAGLPRGEVSVLVYGTSGEQPDERYRFVLR